MRLAFSIALSIGVVVLDQATKRFFEITFADAGHVAPVTPFFNLVLVHNRGVSFGLLSSGHQYAPYLLALVGVAIVTRLSLWLGRSSSGVQRLALAAIIGGAISNIVDRLDDGAVTDFLDFHLGIYHWPAFNLADVAITCGVAALLFESLWPKTRTIETPGRTGSSRTHRP
ncbi:signal peptidase II [Tistrella bauzanensis]|uniref:signal peptidase II n=1 Tax=Tistrella TaxID=171436 RepID=UPI0031F6AC90